MIGPLSTILPGCRMPLATQTRHFDPSHITSGSLLALIGNPRRENARDGGAGDRRVIFDKETNVIRRESTVEHYM
jgi:hypothetical protein